MLDEKFMQSIETVRIRGAFSVLFAREKKGGGL